MAKQDPFSAWLEKKYLEWQIEQGGRATLGQFAEWLDISRPLLSHYLNGVRKPSEENVHNLAAKLGPEIYDVLGLARPDPLFGAFARLLDQLPPDKQEELRQSLAQGTPEEEIYWEALLSFVHDKSLTETIQIVRTMTPEERRLAAESLLGLRGQGQRPASSE